MLEQLKPLANYQSVIVRKHCYSSRTEKHRSHFSLKSRQTFYLVIRMHQGTDGNSSPLKHEDLFLALTLFV